MAQKVVICGAGFLGSSIARVVASSGPRVQISSRRPARVHDSLVEKIGAEQLLPAVPVDITKPATLAPAFEGADVVVSLVGVMHGTPKDFEEIQWKGAESVAKAAKDAGARLIHLSAIGADIESPIPYARTKALAEKSVFEICPDATIIRPSLVFGPGDGFFNRFARLSQYLPFMPVFGGGLSRFQPVYVDDIARAVEIITRNDEAVNKQVKGKIIEAGGPDIFTYKEMMQLVLKYTNRWRPIISLPFAIGTLQGAVLEKLPENLFTVTRAQVEQLKLDNIVSESPAASHASFKDLIEKHSSGPLKSVHDILPTYLS